MNKKLENLSLNAQIIGATMLNSRQLITDYQKKISDPAIKKCQRFVVATSYNTSYTIYQNGLNIHTAYDVNCPQNSLTITYSIPFDWAYNPDYRKSIIDTFEELREKGIIKDCFSKNFPSVIIYRKDFKCFKLIFSSNNNVEVPTIDAYFHKKLNELKTYNAEKFEKMTTFLKFQNKVCPLHKKKQFIVGKIIYDKLMNLNPTVIDNNKQDKLNSYRDLETLNKE